jgi:hypothetical protein
MLVGFGLNGGQVRIDVQFYQGRAVNLRLVARGEVDTQTNLKPGMGPALAAPSGANQPAFAAVETDAARAAQAVADRVAGYYRQQGWLKS